MFKNLESGVFFILLGLEVLNIRNDWIQSNGKISFRHFIKHLAAEYDTVVKKLGFLILESLSSISSNTWRMKFQTVGYSCEKTWFSSLIFL